MFSWIGGVTSPTDAPEDANTKRAMPRWRQASSTRNVVSALPSKSRAGSSTDGGTPVWLARWTTASTPSSAGSRTSGSATSPITTSARSAGRTTRAPSAGRRPPGPATPSGPGAPHEVRPDEPAAPGDQDPLDRGHTLHLTVRRLQEAALILLRILGLVVAVILLVLVVSRFGRRSLTLGDALIMGSVASA